MAVVRPRHTDVLAMWLILTDVVMDSLLDLPLISPDQLDEIGRDIQEVQSLRNKIETLSRRPKLTLEGRELMSTLIATLQFKVGTLEERIKFMLNNISEMDAEGFIYCLDEAK